MQVTEYLGEWGGMNYYATVVTIDGMVRHLVISERPVNFKKKKHENKL